MASNLFKRYIWLADTIHRYGPISLAELRARWQRSSLYDGRPLARRTFHTHREAVEELFDITIVCDEHTNRYSIAGDEELNTHSLTNWLLDGFAVSQSLRGARPLHDRILVEEIPSARNHLPELLDAMRENRLITISYQPFTEDEAFELRLRPLFVKLRERRWYLYADKPDDPKIKLYALDRIVELRVSRECFTPPADLDPAGYLSETFGVAVYDDIPPCTIRIRATGDGAKYLRTLPLHASQREIGSSDGRAIFEYRVAPTPEFCQAMLNIHGNFEVLSPLDLREKMQRLIDRLGELYRHGCRKVIFLDFDGVLNSGRNLTYLHRAGLPATDRYGDLFDPEAVDNLRRIIAATGAMVVVTSSWHLGEPERLEAMWRERELPGFILGTTGRTASGAGDTFPADTTAATAAQARTAKGEAIRNWLNSQAPQGCSYVIFDDEAGFFPEQIPHFIRTDPHAGITRSDAERAIAILSREPGC